MLAHLLYSMNNERWYESYISNHACNALSITFTEWINCCWNQSRVGAVHDVVACPARGYIPESKSVRKGQNTLSRWQLRECEAGASPFVCISGTQVIGTVCKSSAHETTSTAVVILSMLHEAQDFLAKTGMSHKGNCRCSMPPLHVLATCPLVCADL